MEKPYPIKNTITFSDGTETVFNYRNNVEYRAEAEAVVAEAVEGHDSEAKAVEEVAVAEEAKVTE